MARRVKTIVLVTDDITGQELPEGQGQSIRFSWQGTEYEIDLGDGSMSDFEKVMKPYVEAARKVRPTPSRRRRSKAEMRVVRQWGRDHGYTVPDGVGRTPEEVIRAYDEAHR